MAGVKISLITVTYNAAETLERCIRSVIAQNYPNIQYIIIDGGSSDHTADIVNKYKDHIHHYISGPDKGIYDAMNKGIALATGHVIGTLNADDHFADNEVLISVSEAFSSQNVDIVYGDIDFMNKQGKIVRKWRSGKYQHGYYNWGWMPPHPTFYAHKQLFDRYGVYDLNYGTAADYELMLRFMHTNKVDAAYINKVMVEMLAGGASNNNLNSRISAWRNDYKAMKVNGLPAPYLSLLLKPLRKVLQFVK